MKNDRIRVKLFNKTYKEIDLSDFSVIEEELFSNRDDIVSVTLPMGVKVIGANAFEYCRRLEEVVFPDSLERIEKEAFLNCNNLKKAELPKGVVVDPTAFKGCINI